MAIRIKTGNVLSAAAKTPEISTTDMVEFRKSSSEIAEELGELRKVLNAPYEEEEARNSEFRMHITEQMLYLYQMTMPGVRANSVLHTQVALDILNSVSDLNGLKKPINKKPEEKLDIQLELEFSSKKNK